MGSSSRLFLSLLLILLVYCNAAAYKLDDDCQSPNHKCQNSETCIEHSAVCDGDVDCPEGDDELNCENFKFTLTTAATHICPSGQIRCHSENKCIDNKRVCDGFSFSCSDGSDEHDCDSGYNYWWSSESDRWWSEQTNRILCSKEEYRCKGGSGLCIPFNKTCDGTRDCPDGEDENERCHSCQTRNCSHNCHISHRGSHCYCPDGSQLETDGRTCSNINECETNEGQQCQHFCDNLHKNYTCRCAEGYILGSDGHSCHLEKSNEGSLIVNTLHEIGSMPLNATQGNYSVLQKVNFSEHSYCNGFGFMQRTNSIYMNVRMEQKQQLMVAKDGKTKLFRDGLATLGPVAVDWIGDNVYFAQQYSNSSRGITMCSANGTFCRSIVSGRHDPIVEKNKYRSYHSIALNPLTGTMAWIEQIGNSVKVMTANMDGSNAKVLTDDNLASKTLTFDVILNDLFYPIIIYGIRFVAKLNMKTSVKHLLHNPGDYHIQSIVVFNGLLYWSHSDSNTMKVTNISDYSTSVHSSSHPHTFGLAVNHSAYQPLLKINPCDEIKDTCKWMCVVLTNSSGHLYPKCICPDNYVYSEEIKACVIKTYEPIKETSPFWNTILSVFLGILLFCAVFFILYQNSPRVNKITDSTIQRGAQGGAWFCSKIQKNKPVDDRFNSISQSSIEDTLLGGVIVTITKSSETSSSMASNNQSESLSNPMFNDTPVTNMFSL